MDSPTIIHEDEQSCSSSSEGIHVQEEHTSSAFSSSSERTTSAKSESSSSNSELFTKRETRQVNRSKILVYLALAVAAVVVGTLVYMLTANEEHSTFVHEFKAAAEEITANAESNANLIMNQLHSLGIAWTTLALSTNVMWPNATFLHFDVSAREAREVTGVNAVAFAPLVSASDRAGWEQYSWDHQDWIEQSFKDYGAAETFNPGHLSKSVVTYTEATSSDSDTEDESYSHQLYENIAVPLWQISPIPRNASVINLDLHSIPAIRRGIDDSLRVNRQILTGALNLDVIYQDEDIHPESLIIQPVFDDFLNTSRVVGFLLGEVAWEHFFENVLPKGENGIVVEVGQTCGMNFSYQVNGRTAEFLGYGQHHDPAYDPIKISHDFARFARLDSITLSSVEELNDCEHSLTIFASAEFESPYLTNKPAVYTTIVVLVFVCTALTFAVYDFTVARRQKKLLTTAKRTNAIVASMFPKDVQKRILAEAEENEKNEGLVASKLKQRVISGDGGFQQPLVPPTHEMKMIADLFPEATVMFADIVGFTAWSSTREPSQVFILLETIFHEYDEIARRRKVFKVETVGDCYVAVAGVPEPRKDHAIVMARFARDCLYRFCSLVRQLEISLGPDTTDLGVRFGLHSGPVTAGVLRGDRARFQLFGDVMNTTSRIESTGQKNKIHISQETADLLVAHGKGHWCRPREDKVVAKGKGELATYWLELKGDSGRSSSSAGSSHRASEEEPTSSPLSSLPEEVDPSRVATAAAADDAGKFRRTQLPISGKATRLVHWNSEILARLLREVVARREALGLDRAPADIMRQLEQDQLAKDNLVLEEVIDVVTLPKFSDEAAKNHRSASTIELGSAVLDQLRDYLQMIASLYRNNPFHNFEHASHVTMSVVKLLSRIVAPDLQSADDSAAKDLHDHTYGITSDPLTQFAVVLSALIHDVDHPGVPNMQLVKEQGVVAAAYKNKSVAEQNSVDLAWELLMQDRYEDLRRVIYTTPDEFKRFRQLVVNVVMATDIMDKELGAARKARWNVAFAEDSKNNLFETDNNNINRKATIVIEHLIQASDVAHTMQHWQIYRKWNARFFEESYKAFAEGRAEKDPAENWYEGEMGFFDFYIIPLTMKLKNCGVFGVSSDEYLNYAQQNRREWECKGRQIVAEMVEQTRSALLSGKAETVV